MFEFLTLTFSVCFQWGKLINDTVSEWTFGRDSTGFKETTSESLNNRGFNKQICDDIIIMVQWMLTNRPGQWTQLDSRFILLSLTEGYVKIRADKSFCIEQRSSNWQPWNWKYIDLFFTSRYLYLLVDLTTCWHMLSVVWTETLHQRVPPTGVFKGSVHNRSHSNSHSSESTTLTHGQTPGQMALMKSHHRVSSFWNEVSSLIP